MVDAVGADATAVAIRVEVEGEDRCDVVAVDRVAVDRAVSLPDLVLRKLRAALALALHIKNRAGPAP